MRVFFTKLFPVWTCLQCGQKVEGRYRHLTYQKSPHIATIFHVQNRHFLGRNRHFFFKSPHFLEKNRHFFFEKSDNWAKKILKTLTRPFLLLFYMTISPKIWNFVLKKSNSCFFSRKHKIYGKKIATRKKLIATWP